MSEVTERSSGADAQRDVERWRLTETTNDQAHAMIAEKVAQNRVDIGQDGANIFNTHKGRLKERVHIQRSIQRVHQERGVFNGVGADLGAGSGLCTAFVSQIPEVDTVIAVDYSDDFVDFTMPKVFEALGADQSKINRVVGDFNNLEMPDGSLDFVVELGGFHHSEDIDRTLSELHRVLKVGGTAVLIETSNPDWMSNADLERLLDKRKFVVNEAGERVLGDVTRRSLGIHEYRFSDWVSMLEKHGFEIEVPGIWDFHYRISARLWRIPKVRGVAALIYYLRLGLFSHWRRGLRKTNCIFLATKV